MEKSIERNCNRRIQRKVGSLLVSQGYRHTKSTLFVRLRRWVIEFIHLHKFSHGPCYRIHLGIRVLNDRFEASALNGPASDAYRWPGSPNGSQYSFDFGPDLVSVDRCSDEIHRWCVEVGEPWFARFSDPDALLTDSATPFDENEKAALRRAMTGASDSKAVSMSRSLLGCVDE